MTWMWKPSTDVDLCFTALRSTIDKYIQANTVEPVGVLYSIQDAHLIDGIRSHLYPTLMRWQPVPGFPTGAWVLYGPEGMAGSCVD